MSAVASLHEKPASIKDVNDAASVKSTGSNRDAVSAKSTASNKDVASLKSTASNKDAASVKSSVSPSPKASEENTAAPPYNDSTAATACKKNFSQQLKQYRQPILLCLAASLSGLIFGWDVGTIGGITNMTAFKKEFGSLRSDGQYAINHWIVGLIISIFNLFCAFGGLTLSKLADIKGRKMCLYCALVIYHIGTIIQWSSFASGKWYQFMIGRMLTGYAIGCTSVVSPMFIAESAPVEIRGSMVVFYQFMITFGIFLGGLINFGTKQGLNGHTSSWVIPVALGHAFASIVGAAIYFMPESAVYFVSKGENDKALQSVAKMNKTVIADPLVTDEVEKLVANHNAVAAATANASWKDSFRGGSNRTRLAIGVLIMAFQQLTGCNYFFYYGTSLFSRVGIDDSYITAIILGAVNFVATFGGVFLVENLGRKGCFKIGSIVMFVCMLIYALVGGLALEKSGSGAVMILFTCIYIIGFATTWGPVAFVSVSELYSVKTKASSMGIATSANWFMNFLISFFTPSITAQIGYWYGMVFAGCLAASLVFVWFFVPETKNKRIEDVEAEFERFNKGENN